MTVVGTLEAELKADPALWEAAMKRATESMEKLSARVEASSQRIKASGKAAEEAAGALHRLQGSARDLGERFSKIGAVTSGMGAAFSTAVPQMQGAVSAASGLAQSFAAGGPLLAGVALAVTAFTALASKIASVREESDKASKDAADKLKTLTEEAANRAAKSADELEKIKNRIAGLRVDVGNTGEKRVMAHAGLEVSGKEQELDKLLKERTEYERQTQAIQQTLSEQRRQMTADESRSLAELGTKLSGVNKEINNLKQAISLIPVEAGLQVELEKTNKGTPKAAEVAANDIGISRTLTRMIDADNISAQMEGSIADLSDVMQGLDKPVTGVTEKFKGLGDVMRDAEEQAQELAKAEAARARQDGATAAGVIGAVGSGSIGSFASQAGLGAIGAAVSVALGDVTGQIGGQVGSALGGILGPMADDLMAKLGTLKPLFDGLRAVVGALLPAMGLLGDIARTVGGYFASLAPALTSIAEMLTSLFAAIWQNTVKPLINFSTIIVGIVTPALQLLSGALFQIVVFLDQYFYLPIARATKFLYDGMKNAIDGIILAINRVLGMIGLDAIRLSVMPTMAEPTSIIDMLRPALEENTDALKDFSKSLTNLPAGFRYSLTEYLVEEPDGRGSPNRRDMAGRGAMIINGPINITAKNADVLEQIRRTMRQRGVPYGGPPSSVPGSRN